MRALQTLRTLPRDDFLRRVAKRVFRPGLPRRAFQKVASAALTVRVMSSGSYLAARASRARIPRCSDTVLALDAGRWVVATRAEVTSARGAMQRNLGLVVDAFEAAGIPYFLERNLNPHAYRVGIDVTDRKAALDALVAAATAIPVYLASTGAMTEKTTSRRLRSARSLRLIGRPLRATLWRVYQPMTPSAGVSPWGVRHACQVEFWHEDEGDKVAKTRNPIASRVPPEEATHTRVQVGDRLVDSIACFAAADHVDDVTFPIDVVYTWVDDGDERWTAKKNALLRAQGHEEMSDVATSSRFRNRDELRYSMRSLSMFVDFVRQIYLVTDDQVPDWLDTSHGGVIVVDHRDIFGDAGRLPTFNSHAIEARLHKIDGLAEHYLYVNDDVFFGRHIYPQHFFLGNGMSKFFLSKAQIPLGPATESDPGIDAAAKNNRALLRERFGRRITQKMKHTPHAQQRSVVEEMEAESADEFKRTAASQLRHTTNVSVASSLHHHYGYLTGRAIPGSISYDYVNLSRWDLAQRLASIERRRNYDTFCLNDTDHHDDHERRDAIVAEFLETYFPIPAPWER